MDNNHHPQFLSKRNSELHSGIFIALLFICSTMRYFFYSKNELRLLIFVHLYFGPWRCQSTWSGFCQWLTHPWYDKATYFFWASYILWHWHFLFVSFLSLSMYKSITKWMTFFYWLEKISQFMFLNIAGLGLIITRKRSPTIIRLSCALAWRAPSCPPTSSSPRTSAASGEWRPTASVFNTFFQIFLFFLLS